MAKKSSAQAFRFYDNRQKYLAFVNTCNEKSAVARRAALELQQLRPRPPSLNLFDAGMGDGTVLSRMLRYAHSLHPTVPVVAVAKEISLEDVRLGLDKMPERFSRASGHGAGDHQPQLHRCAATDAARSAAGGDDQLAGSPAQGRLGARLRRTDRGHVGDAGRCAGRRIPARRRAIRCTSGRRCW